MSKSLSTETGIQVSVRDHQTVHGSISSSAVSSLFSSKHKDSPNLTLSQLPQNPRGSMEHTVTSLLKSVKVM